MEKIILGNKVIVSDPCYEVGIWCQKELSNVLPGVWEVDVRKANVGNYSIIAELIARHVGYPACEISEFESGRIAVDSGQCGFFDADYYKRHQPDNDYNNLDSWYRRICGITLSSKRWGTVDDKGVVSDTGHGDGLYDLYISKNPDGEIVGMRVEFIDEE